MVGGPSGHGRHAMRRKLQRGKNHKIKTSGPVIGFSRRETFIFELRFGWFASLVFDPPNSAAEVRLFGGAFDRLGAWPHPTQGMAGLHAMPESDC
jgi:hypothetical protein